MTKSSDSSAMRGDHAVEELLRRASPRPTPPAEDERIVREAVHAEWQAVTGRIRTRQRVTYLAAAAAVLLGLVVALNALQVSHTPAVQVATINKSHGSIYLLGEQAELKEMTDLASIVAGQVIQTGNGAGIGLDWGNGGSLRVDENTRVEFTSGDSVYLRSGRIYFDSLPSQMIAGNTASDFEISTDHGLVRHLGTQYMTFTDADKLSVSVREGEVLVDGVYVEEATAHEGEQLTVSGGARPTVVNINGYGEAWDWIEATAPAIDIDGQTVDDFLTWIGRETGLRVSYESPAAEHVARSGVLRGEVDMKPREELAFRMAGEDLDYRIADGTIYVRTSD